MFHASRPPSLHRASIHLLLAFAVWAAASPAAWAQLQQRPPAPEELRTLFNDFLHFARLGKFTEATAFATKLLEHPELDPQVVLSLADQDKQTVPTLTTLIAHTTLRDQAQEILDLIREGEFLERQDIERIRENVSLLGGPPQTEFNAIQRLQESGEYAIPVMINALLDPSKTKLWPRVIRALPQIGKPAVTPLAIALRVPDADVQRNIVWALGEIGYPHAVPYLLKLLDDSSLPSQTRAAASEALARIRDRADFAEAAGTAPAFIRLANQYYDEHGSIKADPRLAIANVWYWVEGRLVPKPVPTVIFGSVMAMRCCEEALLRQADQQEAIALWLASNIRREARLGMDVESPESDAGGDADSTRGEDFPRSIYFSRAAGPDYCHRVLGRAVKDGDKHVALGAIAALDVVAGPASLVGPEDYKQPLVQALRFPDAEVRIKAAIALARALPLSAFAGSEVVGHVLAEALMQSGQENFVIVDRELDSLNRLAGEFRGEGAEVVAETSFYGALERARRELPNIHGFIVTTDVESPPLGNAIAELRNDYRYRRVPVVIITKPRQEHRAQMAMQDGRSAPVTTIEAGVGASSLRDAIMDLADETGGRPLDRAMAVELALRAADALRLVAVNGRTVIDVRPTIPALITALAADEQALQISAANVLALVESADGQQSVAELALDAANNAALRIAAFAALAESAKRQGNHLTPDQITRVVQAAMETADLPMRSAASEALGALNLRQNEASAIIRSTYSG